MQLFDSFKANKVLLQKTKFVKIYSVKCGDKNYTVILLRKMANKHTIIHFNEDTVYWEQLPRFYRLAGRQWGYKIPIHKFNDIKINNTIFVLRGSPLGDEGLDNGIFRSSKKYDENYVNCITFKKFKNM